MHFKPVIPRAAKRGYKRRVDIDYSVAESRYKAFWNNFKLARKDDIVDPVHIEKIRKFGIQFFGIGIIVF